MWIMCKVFSKHTSTLHATSFTWISYTYLYTYSTLYFSTSFFSLASFPISFSISLLPRQRFSSIRATLLSFHSFFILDLVCVRARSRFSFEARELCRLFWRLKWQMWVLLQEKYMLFTCMCELRTVRKSQILCLFLHFPNDSANTHTHTQTHTRTHTTCSRSLFTFTTSLHFSILHSSPFLLFLLPCHGLFSHLFNFQWGKLMLHAYNMLLKVFYKEWHRCCVYVAAPFKNLTANANGKYRREKSVSNHLVYNILIFTINMKRALPLCSASNT